MARYSWNDPTPGELEAIREAAGDGGATPAPSGPTTVTSPDGTDYAVKVANDGTLVAKAADAINLTGFVTAAGTPNVATALDIPLPTGTKTGDLVIIGVVYRTSEQFVDFVGGPGQDHLSLNENATDGSTGVIVRAVVTAAVLAAGKLTIPKQDKQVTSMQAVAAFFHKADIDRSSGTSGLSSPALDAAPPGYLVVVALYPAPAPLEVTIPGVGMVRAIRNADCSFGAVIGVLEVLSAVAATHYVVTGPPQPADSSVSTIELYQPN